MLGTFVAITAWGASPTRLEEAVAAAFAEFEQVDAVMSNHRSDSELSRINQRAFQEPVAVSDLMFEVVQEALRISEATKGGFDVTIHPLTELWGFVWKLHRMPAPAELQKALPRVGYQKVRLDPATRSIRFLDPGVSMDLGGIGKGFAVDRAVDRMVALGVTNLLVRAGGDLRVMGDAPGRKGWIVQIEDPRKEGRRTAVQLVNAALSTSGTYENFFKVNGKVYSHILDPRTGLPVEGIASCTLIARRCVESDAWATACIVYGVEPSLKDFGNRFGIRYMLVPRDERGEWIVRETPGFPLAQ